MLKKYEWVRQDDLKDCGVCSLLTIIKTYGGDVSKEYLRELTKTSKEGTNAFYLLEAGKKLGFSTKALKGNIIDLDNNLLPCIAHVIIDNKYSHFVVIMNINKKKGIVTISDPATGIKKYQIDDFRKISTGNYLIFIPNRAIPIYVKNKTIFKIIYSLFIQYKSVFISIFLFSFFVTIISIISSFIFQFIIDIVISYHSKVNLYFIFVIMIFLYSLKSLMELVRNNLLLFINHTLDHKLIVNIFNHIISLPYLYYKSRTTGEVISRINDLGDIKETISRLFITFFVDLVLSIFVFFTLYSINSKLTMIGLIMISIYFIIIRIFNKFFNCYIMRNQEDAAKVNSYMIESINNIDTVKSLSIENEVNNCLEIKYNRYLNSSYKFQKLYNYMDFIKNMINYIGISIITFIAVLYVLEGNMTIGEVITYHSMIIYFLEPIKNVIEMELVIRKTKISIDRVTELYEVESEKLEIDKKYQGKKIKGDIIVKNLNYSYNGRKNILNNINLKINSGDKVILFGKSGCGKSTLGKILMKFFDTAKEKVFIDDIDINEFNILDIRREFCYIGQNEQLFTETIYNNIVLNRECEYGKFLSIANIVKLNEIVKNNILSYEMPIEENGFNISGGERQRIILARALVKDSSVYILDESLSQLDIKKEREILHNLFEYLHDKTVIYISHRFDNSDLFNKKINMELSNA